MQRRLSQASLRALREDLLPPYDRTATPSMVHIGVGAFARAHVATFADDLSRAGRPLLIRGVSLRSARAQEQLSPQDCLYSVTERGGTSSPRLRVRGAITSVATGPDAAIKAIAAPETELVTLTLTEKGYGGPDEPLHPHQPASGPGVVARGLAERRQARLRTPIICSLDNLRQNGEVLRRAVTAHAARLDPALADWIATEVAFPSSVVDRMVPAPTDSDLAYACEALGLADLAAVKTEIHRSWVMTAVEGLPPLDEVGVQLVADVTPYEDRKLWLLNGPHSALAYPGLATGCRTIAEAAAHPLTSSFVAQIVDDILEVTHPSTSGAARRFADETLDRFANPALDHTCAKVATDGSHKLPERYGAVVAARQGADLPTSRFSVVIALWLMAAVGLPLASGPMPAIEDPMAPHLGAVAQEGDLGRLVHEGVGAWTDPALQHEVLHTVAGLQERGLGILEGLP